jgi:hypothetical protein
MHVMFLQKYKDRQFFFVDTTFWQKRISLQRIVWVTINCCSMSKMLPTWLNVPCRRRNWNFACPSHTSNFGLRCTQLGRTACPKLCLQMITIHERLSSLHPPTCKQISSLIQSLVFSP